MAKLKQYHAYFIFFCLIFVMIQLSFHSRFLDSRVLNVLDQPTIQVDTRTVATSALNQSSEVGGTNKRSLREVDNISGGKSRPTHLPSDRWQPSVVTKCNHDGNFHFIDSSAPCLKEKLAENSNLLHAQELIYPAFKLRLPEFPRNDQKQKWIDHCNNDYEISRRMHIDYNKEWGVYPTQHGQNLVFEKVLLKKGSIDFDSWKNDLCTQYGASHSAFLQTSDENNMKIQDDIKKEETVIVANTPDSWSFQHFMGRVTKVWLQSSLLQKGGGEWGTFNNNNSTILTGKAPTSSSVEYMYSKMNIKKRLHKLESNLFVERLIYSCRTPQIHPYLFQRFSELLTKEGQPQRKSLNGNITSSNNHASKNNQTTKMVAINNHAKKEERNVILYASRNEGTLNGGRKVLDEEKVLKNLKVLLVKRNKNETLVMFKDDMFSSPAELVNFFQTKVLAMIGPHGGALYNFRFASKGALLYEIQKEDKMKAMFWEQSRNLEQQYLTYIAKAVGKNMKIGDVDLFIQHFEKFLPGGHKQTNNDESFLSENYQWESVL